MPGDSTLRPYYDHDTFNAGYSVIFKPGVGLIDTNTQNEITSAFAHKMTGNNGSLGSSFGMPKVGLSTPARADRLMSATDKNYVYDLELSEYFDFNNLSEVLKNLVGNFFKNYCRILLSQPLDIVRLILQVGYFDFSRPQKPESYTRLADLSVSETADESFYEDEPDFFQPAIPQNTASAASSPAKGKSVKAKKNPHKIHPLSQHTIDIMTAVASKDGPFALFRGINASLIHYTLSHTIEAWITGFLSPFLNIPDPFFLDLTHSPEPAKSLWLSVSACVLTGVILMPLDLIKVRLMITSFNKVVPPPDATETESASPVSSASSEANEIPRINKRSVRDSIRHYPRSLLMRPPPSITLLTVLYQFSTIVFRKSAPYLLFVRYNIDAYSSPNWFTVANLLLSITEFFVKLPVENLLRKEQVRFLLKPKTAQEDEYRVVTIDNPDEDLIVDFNNWDLKHAFPEQDEDFRGPGLWTRIRMLGLFKGWRVGVLNVIGFWGYNIFKTTSVMAEERL